MPIFEFICADCGHEFEELVLAGEQPACSRCRSLHLEKRFSAFAVNAPAQPSAGSCGACGDPRGPGACSL